MVMKKLIVILFILGFITIHGFTQTTVTIKEVSGKVEIQVPGGNWQPAEAGMIISQGTMISTGFGSTAVLELKGALVTVNQLARIELTELLEKEGALETKMNLDFGKIDADIFSTEGLEHNFELKSPISTASVRGCSFSFDGFTLDVTGGTVLYINNLGQVRTINVGEMLQTDGTTMPISLESGLLDDFNVIPFTSFEDILPFIPDIPTLLEILEELPIIEEEYSTVIIYLNWD
jgi:hypothetical protein